MFGAPFRHPRARGTTVLQLAPGTDRRAKLAIADGYGDVPVRASVVVPAQLPGPLMVGCRDAGAVTIRAVRDVPPGSL